MTRPHSYTADKASTPRTDAAAKPGEYGQPYEVVDAEFARQLERELVLVGCYDDRCRRDTSPPEKSPEVRLNDDGTLDEVVHPAAHLEQMDDDHWFLEVGPNGNSVAVWLHSKSKITASFEHRRDATNGEGILDHVNMGSVGK